MRMMLRVVLATPLLIGATGPQCQPGGRSETIGGRWGGDHVELVATDTGATLEYDCAHGAIAGRILTDESGRFTATGTHVREHGGPIREGEIPDAHPASYTGDVRGDRMTLTVRETDSGTVLGPFTLMRGVSGRLMKCL